VSRGDNAQPTNNAVPVVSHPCALLSGSDGVFATCHARGACSWLRRSRGVAASSQRASARSETYGASTQPHAASLLPRLSGLLDHRSGGRSPWGWGARWRALLGIRPPRLGTSAPLHRVERCWMGCGLVATDAVQRWKPQTKACVCL